MKKIITLSILGLIICTAFNTPAVSGFSRLGNTTPTDYRDAYTGKYFCKRICSTLNMDTKRPDFTTDTLSIYVTKTATDSIVQVNFNNGVLKLKLNNKFLKSYNEEGHSSGKFFAADSVDFYFAPGRSSSCRYLGKKKP